MRSKSKCSPGYCPREEAEEIICDFIEWVEENGMDASLVKDELDDYLTHFSKTCFYYQDGECEYK